MAEKKTTSPLKYFISGGFGGICTVVVGHPLDTIKVRLQTMPKPQPGEQPLYKGTWDCAKKTVKQEGVRGLYKGMGAPLLGVAPIFAISFFGFGLGKKLVHKYFYPHEEEHTFTLKELFFAGAFSGLFTSIVMAPGERIKVLLQIQQGSHTESKYKGPVDVVKSLYKQGGIRSLYKGTVATLLRDIPASGAYFSTYEYLRILLKSNNESENYYMELAKIIFCGGLAGMANWLVGLPADVIKSRIQSAPEGRYPNGLKDILHELLKEEGFLGLYKGTTPVLLRAFPANAACFIGFEGCHYLLDMILPN